MKLLVHSPTSTVQPLKFGKGYVISSHTLFWTYRKTSNISRTSVGDEIVDNSDVVEASPVGTAPTTSSFST